MELKFKQSPIPEYTKVTIWKGCRCYQFEDAKDIENYGVRELIIEIENN